MQGLCVRCMDLSSDRGNVVRSKTLQSTNYYERGLLKFEKTGEHTHNRVFGSGNRKSKSQRYG